MAGQSATYGFNYLNINHGPTVLSTSFNWALSNSRLDQSKLEDDVRRLGLGLLGNGIEHSAFMVSDLDAGRINEPFTNYIISKLSTADLVKLRKYCLRTQPLRPVKLFATLDETVKKFREIASPIRRRLPKWKAIHNQNIYSALDSGNPQKAIELLKEGLRKDPIDTKWMVMIAKALINMRESDKAITYLKKCVGLVKNEQAMTLLARAYVNTKRYYDAEKLYHEVLVMNPRDVYALNGLALLYYDQHEYDLSLSAYHRALQCSEDNPVAYIGLADIMIKKRKIKEALEYLQKVNNPRFGLYVRLGLVYGILGVYDKAKLYYQKALTFNKRVGYVKRGLADIELRYGHLHEARNILENLLKDDPTSAVTRLKLAEVYAHMGQSEESDNKYFSLKSINMFKSVLEDNSEHISASYGLAKAYVLINEYDKALKMFDREYVVNDQNVIRFKREKANLFMKMERYSDAIDLYVQACEMNPDDHKLKTSLGQAHLKLGDKKQMGVKLLNEVRAKYPNDLAVRFILFDFYFKQEAFGKAKELILEAEQAHPQNVAVRSRIVKLKSIVK